MLWKMTVEWALCRETAPEAQGSVYSVEEPAVTQFLCAQIGQIFRMGGVISGENWGSVYFAELDGLQDRGAPRL